jgi:hypothetical protein
MKSMPMKDVRPECDGHNSILSPYRPPGHVKGVRLCCDTRKDTCKHVQVINGPDHRQLVICTKERR